MGMHEVVTAPKVPKRKRRWKARILFGVSLAVLSAVILWSKKGPHPIMITSERAALRDITQLVSATGKIRPRTEVKISPEVAGEIIEMPVVLGQQVTKGQMLVRIKPDNYVARVKQAEASLRSAQADSLQRKAQMQNDDLELRRTTDLFKKRLISEEQHDAAETKAELSRAAYESSLHQIDVAKSNLDQNLDLLDKCVIYSPINGSISVLSSEIGERVVATADFAGTEVMRVADLSSMEARADVNENDVVNVKVGNPVRIRVDAYPGKLLEGIVRQIASTATVKSEGTQREVTNFEVRIRVIAKPEIPLRPGMSINVDIETRTVHRVVSMPIQSVTVRTRGAGKTAEQWKADHQKQTGINSSESERQIRKDLQRVVFLKRGDKAKMVPVETGIADNNFIEIRSDVKEGDEVISGSYTALNEELKEGSTIKDEQ
jgi:HlyD family secretion protein